ncbi:MAG: TolC family protein [Bacteroidales bacterium]|nr:TolC family protein [Bacteroidales bacterium]
MKRIFLIAILILGINRVNAQNSVEEEFLSLTLPPLETLFEGIRNSPTVQFYNYRTEGEELMLKTERRRWQEYISFYASYQYGVMAMNAYSNIGLDYPMIYQYSGSAQMWYSAGAMVRIPLDQLFDRGNRIRRQQLKIEETRTERELWYDEQKLRLIELYTKTQEMLGNLNQAIQMFILADAQFKIAEKEFILGGSNNPGALSNAKGQQVQAVLQLERVKSELNSAILKMEVMSGTKIINR